MKREQAAFLCAGVVLGFALGFAVAWGMGRARGPVATAALSAPARPEEPSGSGGGEAVMSQVFGRIEELKDQVERDPGDVESLVELANIYLQVDRAEEARGYLERAVEAEPGNVHALTHLGIVQADSGDLEAARDRFRRTVEIDPSYWEGWFYLAVTESQRGDLAGAREAVDRLEALNPDLPELAELKRHLDDPEGVGP